MAAAALTARNRVPILIDNEESAGSAATVLFLLSRPNQLVLLASLGVQGGWIRGNKSLKVILLTYFPSGKRDESWLYK